MYKCKKCGESFFLMKDRDEHEVKCKGKKELRRIYHNYHGTLTIIKINVTDEEASNICLRHNIQPENEHDILINYMFHEPMSAKVRT